MALLGNILWLVLGGWIAFLFYLLGAILFFPLFIPLFRLAVYAAWPFGRTVVTQAQLEKYRELTGANPNVSGVTRGLRTASGILNVVWMLTFGWLLALVHLGGAIINVFLFWMIVTIPNIGGHWKLIPVAFMPFNKVIVPATLGQAINDRLVRDKLGI